MRGWGGGVHQEESTKNLRRTWPFFLIKGIFQKCFYDTHFIIVILMTWSHSLKSTFRFWRHLLLCSVCFLSQVPAQTPQPTYAPRKCKGEEVSTLTLKVTEHVVNWVIVNICPGNICKPFVLDVEYFKDEIFLNSYFSRDEPELPFPATGLLASSRVSPLWATVHKAADCVQLIIFYDQ